MAHKHECPTCGKRKWCDIPDCILDSSDLSECDACSSGYENDDTEDDNLESDEEV
jgi:hypothetical protein